MQDRSFGAQTDQFPKNKFLTKENIIPAYPKYDATQNIFCLFWPKSHIKNELLSNFLK